MSPRIGEHEQVAKTHTYQQHGVTVYDRPYAFHPHREVGPKQHDDFLNEEIMTYIVVRKTIGDQQVFAERLDR